MFRHVGTLHKQFVHFMGRTFGESAVPMGKFFTHGSSPHLCLAMVLLLSGATWGQDCFQLRPEPLKHNFALVIDRSGSMQGAPLQQAMAGARLFVDRLQAGDRATVIAFDDKVQVLAGMTEDRQALKGAIGRLTSGGSTALYDAIVRAAGAVLAEDGARIIVFLTDGADTGSQYSLPDIASLGLSEGIFIYGIGLGELDLEGLVELAQATGGSLELTLDPRSLGDLYQRVLGNYYENFAAQMAETGAYAIRSLPAGAEVRLGGQSIGRTPLKVDNVPPGEYAVEVVFERGGWSCSAPAQSGYRTLVDAREDDLGHDLWIASRPHGAVVFMDGSYVGVTSLDVVDTRKPGWGQQVKGTPTQLRIPLVPRGKHVLRLVAMPDLDFGPEQQIEFEFDMGGQERVLQIDIFTRKVTVDDGSVIRQSPGERMQEQFQQLEEELDE